MMHTTRHGSEGFSLIEVMVALIVVTLGLLGLAKMEALALSSADVSGNRALAAMQASSMAAMMHADHDYWQSSAATSSAVMTWNGVDAPTISDATLISVSSCSIAGSGACTPLQMAGNDVYNWGFTLYNVLGPSYKTTIVCTPATLAASPPTPVTCTITISWAENAVAANSAQSGLANLATPSFTLNVQP